jgi:hypothetical protein
MQAENDRSAEGLMFERRSRRTNCLADALRFQLDACREAEGLAAIVVSDDLGFCVAHSGGDDVHAELAARMPGLANPARAFNNPDSDELLQLPRSALVVTTFSIAGSTLHACAVAAPQAGGAGDAATGLAVLDRVASGFSRLLA